MAVFSGTVYSKMLGMRTNVEVMFPTDELNAADAKPKAAAYFLHGLTDNAGAYSRWTNIAWLVRKHHFVAVMPEVNRSWYCDMRYGARYFSYVTQELPTLLNEMLDLPEKALVAGNSMGGYGAVKALLRFPEKYLGAACLSGALDLDRLNASHPELRSELQAVWGMDGKVPPEDDVYALAETAEIEKKRVWISCGLEDGFLNDSRRLEALLRRRGADLSCQYVPGGHDWDCWIQSLEPAIEYLLQAASAPEGGTVRKTTDEGKG